MKPRPPSQKNDTSDRQSPYKKSFDAKNIYEKKDRWQKVENQIALKVPVSSQEVSMQILS